MASLRLLYFGTPAFAVPTLVTLAGSAHEIVAVVTQPDRPRGRGPKVMPEAVKTAALERGFRVLQPTRLKDPNLLDELRALRPDLGIVAAYGRILPDELLALPRLGIINVHASLLPRWRGAAPVHRAILAGDTTTGVTIMRVVSALDAGPMLAKVTVAIDPNETSVELERRLAAVGADALVATVDRLAGVGSATVSSAGLQSRVTEEPQDETLATYAPKLERRDSQIDWTRPAAAIHNQIRGLHPWPLAAAELRGKRLLLLRSELGADEVSGTTPGIVAGVTADTIDVAAGSGLVRLLALQPEGRSPMSVRAFLSGHRVVAGDRFAPVRVPKP
jgi:methionyl-tRNA formyltransferase